MAMASRVVWTVVVVASVVVLSLVAAAIDGHVSRDDAFVIDRFEQRVQIDPAGVTDVVEIIDVTFRESRRGIFRDLDSRTAHPSTDTFRDFEVDQGSADAPWDFAIEGGPSGPRVRIGQAEVFLDPGPYRYRLLYVAPSWFYELADDPGTVEARIDFPGFDWPTSIGPSRIVVEVPGPVTATACVEGPRRTTQPCARAATVEGNQATFEVGPFEDRQAATVAVQFPRDAFDAAATIPVFDAVPLGQGGLGQPLGVDRFGAAIILLVLLIVPILLWEKLSSWVVYRDRVTDPALHDRQHPTALPGPPFGWAPVEVAGLLLRTDGSELFLSTLIDLDQRGLVQTRTEVVPRRVGRDKQVLTMYPGVPPTNAEDAEILKELLPEGEPVRFDGEFDPEVAARVKEVEVVLSQRADQVYESNGFVHDAGGLLGALWFRALVGLVFLFYAAGLVFLARLLTPLHVLSAVGIVALVVVGWDIIRSLWRHQRLALNSAGRDAGAQARSFETFVRTVEGEQLQWAAGQPRIDHHHPAISLLPYAVVMGLADSWYRRFEGVLAQLAAAGAVGATGLATWYLNPQSFSDISRAQASSSGSGGRGGGGSGGGGGGGGSW